MPSGHTIDFRLCEIYSVYVNSIYFVWYVDEHLNARTSVVRFLPDDSTNTAFYNIERVIETLHWERSRDMREMESRNDIESCELFCEWMLYSSVRFLFIEIKFVDDKQSLLDVTNKNGRMDKQIPHTMRAFFPMKWWAIANTHTQRVWARPIMLYKLLGVVAIFNQRIRWVEAEGYNNSLMLLVHIYVRI